MFLKTSVLTHINWLSLYQKQLHWLCNYLKNTLRKSQVSLAGYSLKQCQVLVKVEKSKLEHELKNLNPHSAWRRSAFFHICWETLLEIFHCFLKTLKTKFSELNQGNLWLTNATINILFELKTTKLSQTKNTTNGNNNTKFTKYIVSLYVM